MTKKELDEIIDGLNGIKEDSLKETRTFKWSSREYTSPSVLTTEAHEEFLEEEVVSFLVSILRRRALATKPTIYETYDDSPHPAGEPCIKGA